MRIFALLLSILVASPLGAQARPNGAEAGAELVDRVVAVVGDTVLLLSDVHTELAQLEAAGQLPADPLQRDEFAQQVMESRINDLILVQAALDAGLELPQEQVNEQVDQQIRQVQQRFGSESAFTAALAESGLTRDQYRQTLANQIRDEQLVQLFLGSRLRNRAPPVIDEREIQAFFATRAGTLGQRPATVSFQQVVVAPKPSEEARRDAIARAEEVLEEIRTGADFAVLARRFSDDTGSAEHGGDLGWFKADRMVPEFSRAAFSLRPGQTSGLVESEFGFHIIKLERTRGAERQARHILIRPEVAEADVALARERADSVAQAIRDGASVTSLAGRYNANEDLPTVTRFALDRLPPGYLEPLRNAAVGEVVGPFTLPDPRGDRFAVARINEQIPAGEYTIDDVRDQIRQNLEQQSMVEQLLGELRQQVYVQTML